MLHSHADSILTLTNLADGADRVRRVFGDRVVVIPYVMPGFDLARLVRERWPIEAHDATIGMVLLQHGLFAFGDTCAEAAERHAELIDLADRHISGGSGGLPTSPGVAGEASGPAVRSHECALELAELRRQISELAERPMIMSRNTTPDTMRFVERSDLEALAGRGPLTPDHVIHTKPVPLIGRDVAAYGEWYAEYFAAHRDRSRQAISMLDPAPRVVLDPELGMLTVGNSARAAQIVADIYDHTIEVATVCEDRLGGWLPLEREHQFDVEYWDLEQAKLRRAGAPPPLAGRVAIVTGAASGIGRACAQRLLGEGAAVAGLDSSPAVTEMSQPFDGFAWHGIQIDVTEAERQRAAIDEVVEHYGGIDIAVLCAGKFGPSAPLAELAAEDWRAAMAVNLDAAMQAMSTLHPFLALSPGGGRVVLIGSKNVAAPGTGAVAYSASKAAITQVARVAALEWAADGIRVNTVHPDAVFDTGLWTADLVAERAAAYSMTVEEYKTRNLLGVEITSDQVAQLVVSMVGPAFSATTGAQIPLDGGTDRTL